MRFILCLSFSLFFYTLNAQNVNNFPIADIDAEYIELSNLYSGFSSKTRVALDYGQYRRMVSNDEMAIKDDFGKYIEFNSMMEAVNYMSQFGYELAHAYTASPNDRIYYFYVMRKKKQEN